jgi:DNA mismatch repair ATPase MutS
MNIVDEKGVHSLFESEMYRILNNLNQVIKNNKENKLSILFLDELFNSTNVIEGISGSYSICKKLASLNSNITLLTTHFTYLYKLEKDSNFKNYKMNAIVNNNDIIFPYKLLPGYSTQYIAIELLKNENNLEKYEYLTKDVFNEAIHFKQKLLNLNHTKKVEKRV